METQTFSVGSLFLNLLHVTLPYKLIPLPLSSFHPSPSPSKAHPSVVLLSLTGLRMWQTGNRESVLGASNMRMTVKEIEHSPQTQVKWNVRGPPGQILAKEGNGGPHTDVQGPRNTTKRRTQECVESEFLASTLLPPSPSGHTRARTICTGISPSQKHSAPYRRAA